MKPEWDTIFSVIFNAFSAVCGDTFRLLVMKNPVQKKGMICIHDISLTKDPLPLAEHRAKKK
jgi:hypothetical protein